MYSFSSLHPETFQAGTISSGDCSGQDDPGTLRPSQLKIQQLQLTNPHQHSYAHATLLSLLWTASCIQDGLPIANKGLHKFLRWLSTQSKPQPLWQIMDWQALTKSWSQPLRHHDPAAFLQYLQPLIFTAGAGVWQAKSSATNSPTSNQCQVSASGHAWPISLPAVLNPVNPCSLQALVLQWHNQAQVHGLSQLSPLLALRIHRFDDRGDRVPFSIQNSWKVDIPLYVDHTSATRPIPYEVSAIILHYGDTVSQGQCSAVLLEDSSPKFLTADGKKASKVRAKDIPQICQNAYIAILKPQSVTV